LKIPIKLCLICGVKKNNVMKHLTFQNIKCISIVTGLCFYILTISSCNKSPNNSNNYININPPAGNYYSTVFCNINDSNWCDCSVGGGPRGWKSSGVTADYYTNSGGTPLQIESKNVCSTNLSDLFIYLIPFNGIGKYYLTKQNNGCYAGYAKNLEGIYLKNYETNFDYNGIVEITEFDTIKRVFSGSFYFDALYSDSNQVAKITKGTLVKVKYN